MGARLNHAEDSLDMAAFLDRWINRFGSYDVHGALTLDRLAAPMNADFQTTLRAHLNTQFTASTFSAHDFNHTRSQFAPATPLTPDSQTVGAAKLDARWGWKEPRSIFLLPFWNHVFPQMKFLHVTRDGRDMAFSENQNQLRKHGRVWLTWRERTFAARPLRSIMLWSRLNSAAADYGEQVLRERYLRVRFEDLCADGAPVVRRILEFLESTGDAEEIARREVSAPASIGRFREQKEWQIELIERAAGETLRRFGYI